MICLFKKHFRKVTVPIFTFFFHIWESLVILSSNRTRRFHMYVSLSGPMKWSLQKLTVLITINTSQMLYSFQFPKKFTVKIQSWECFPELITPAHLLICSILCNTYVSCHGTVNKITGYHALDGTNTFWKQKWNLPPIHEG